MNKLKLTEWFKSRLCASDFNSNPPYPPSNRKQPAFHPAGFSEPCSTLVPRSVFLFLLLWRWRALLALVCDVCCEISAVSPEETRTAPSEGGEVFAGPRLGWTLCLIFILPAARALLWSALWFAYLCSTLLLISFTSWSCFKDRRTLKLGEWPADGVKRQPSHTLKYTLKTPS